MSFKTNLRVVEDIREEKQIRKILPYTVTPIGGKAELATWKADQQRKQDEWNAGRADRYAEAKDRAIGVMQGTRKPTDPNAKADRAFEQLEQQSKKQTLDSTTSVIEVAKSTEVEEKSFLGKLVDKFLDVNFEPKE